MQTVHGFFVNYQMNPFSPIGQPITSERFRLAVDRQVNAYNAE
jgi:Sedlin, N-terminal conserved region